MMSSGKKDSVQVFVKLLLITLLAKERDQDLILANRKDLAENKEVEDLKRFKKTDYERESKRHWLKRTCGEHLMQPSAPSGTVADPRSGQRCF